MTIRAFSTLAIMIALLSSGCRRMTDSGLPKALVADSLLTTAGSSQGINIGSSGGGASGGGGGDAVEYSTYFTAKISSGTRGQLMTAYRDAIKKAIEDRGIKIHGQGEAGAAGGDLSAFNYSYSWSVNHGLVRVQSFVGGDGQIQISVFCYEHR